MQSLIDEKYEIYCITNIANGKKYIGITKQGIKKRFKRHINDAFYKNNLGFSKISRAIKKHGKELFSIEKIDECYGFSNATKLEINYIKHHDTYRNGYNSTTGGEGAPCVIVAESTREKLRIKSTGRKMSSDAIEKTRIANIGKKLPEWNIELLRKINIGNKNRLGKKHSEYTKIKISNSMKGKKHTEETKIKIGNAKIGHKYNLGKIHTESHNHKISMSLINNKNALGYKHSKEECRKHSERAKLFWKNRKYGKIA